MKLPSTPSPKLVGYVQIFRLSLGIFLLIGTLLLNSCSSSNGASLNWSNTNSVDKALLQSAISQNTSLPPDKAANILVASVKSKSKDECLYVFNYNSADTCGFLGCLYAVYLDNRKHAVQQVMSVYLQPNLPQGEQLISVSSDTPDSASLPCLDVRQVSEKDTLLHVTYCFNGSSYQPVKSARYKLP